VENSCGGADEAVNIDGLRMLLTQRLSNPARRSDAYEQRDGREETREKEAAQNFDGKARG